MMHTHFKVVFCWAFLLISETPMCDSQQVPGIDAWRTAIARHSEAENRLETLEAQAGQIHQARGIIKHEQQTSQNTYQNQLHKFTDPMVKKKLKSEIKESLLKAIHNFIANKSGSSDKSDLESKLRSLLNQSIRSSAKGNGSREGSFLDQLLNHYTQEENEIEEADQEFRSIQDYLKFNNRNPDHFFESLIQRENYIDDLDNIGYEYYDLDYDYDITLPYSRGTGLSRNPNNRIFSILKDSQKSKTRLKGISRENRRLNNQLRAVLRRMHRRY